MLGGCIAPSLGDADDAVQGIAGGPLLVARTSAAVTKRLKAAPCPRRRVAPVELMIRAPATKVWRVIGDEWGSVHRILPSLSASHLVTDGALGTGARRECTLKEPMMGMTTIEERVLAWNEGASFTYVFDRPPWPMASVSNRWNIEAIGDRTRLTLTPLLEMRGGAWTQWMAPALLWAMSRSLKGDLPRMVEAIERECARLPAA